MSLRLTQLQQLYTQSPNDPFIWFAMAKEYEKLKDKENTYFYYQKLFTEKPDYIGTYYHFGKWYESQNQFDKALEIYTLGVQKAQEIGDKHAWSELAEAKLNLE